MRLYYKGEEAEVDRTVAAHPEYQKVAVPNGFIITQVQPDLEKAKDVAAAYAFDMERYEHIIAVDGGYIHLATSDCNRAFGKSPREIAVASFDRNAEEVIL